MLELADVIDFIRGSEWALLYSSVIGEPPISFVVRQLRDEWPELKVGSVLAFGLASAPAGLRDYLAPELHRHGLSDLWLPNGYYLFGHGSLVAHHHARPPEVLSDYAGVLLVAGVALVEWLYTRRRGRAAEVLLPTLEAAYGQRPVDAFRPHLRAARARRSGSSGRTTTGDGRQGRGAEPPGAGARGGAGRASADEERGSSAASEPLWSGDPYEVLGVTPSASDQDIKTAYRRLTLEHHPDKARGEQDRCERELRQQRLNLAYQSIRGWRGR